MWELLVRCWWFGALREELQLKVACGVCDPTLRQWEAARAAGLVKLQPRLAPRTHAG